MSVHKERIGIYGDTKKGRLLRKMARKMALTILAVMTCVFLVTLADCGCKKESENKKDAPVEVEEQDFRDTRETQDSGVSAPDKSPSEVKIENALKSGKPVFLNFHSNQCIPCIEMEKVIEEVEPEFADRVAFVVVDVYDRAEWNLCDYFQVRVIPTSFFIDTSGKVMEAYEGLLDTHRMRELLNGLVAGTLGQKTTP